MSADRLRAAAALLQELADSATPGPWNATGFWGVRGNGDRNWVADTTVSQAQLPDAMLIEAMNPTVALAVADWLSAADEYYGHDTLTDRAALAVADSILAGGAS